MKLELLISPWIVSNFGSDTRNTCNLTHRWSYGLYRASYCAAKINGSSMNIVFIARIVWTLCVQYCIFSKPVARKQNVLQPFMRKLFKYSFLFAPAFWCFITRSSRVTIAIYVAVCKSCFRYQYVPPYHVLVARISAGILRRFNKKEERERERTH